MKLLLILPVLAILAKPLDAFTEPRSPMPLKAEIVTEKLESMDIPRIKLSGKRDIQMDYIDIFSIEQPKDESVLLQHKFLPSNRFEFYVYPNTSIQGEIDSRNVANYLNRLRNTAVRNDEFFEVVAEPEPEGAPTKIRFLGAKPITIEYVIKREEAGEAYRSKIMEAWAQLDDHTYRLRIEAPEDRFDAFFRQCKSLANSMFFLS